MRIAIVEKDKCHPDKCGDYLCARLCPVNRMDEECITKAEDGKAAIDANLCTGCGICPKRCPFGAIHIINLPEELEHPIHQFGDNEFHLYNLPIPIFGKVVGIVGANGIGKTTAIKILAGVLKPNLGKPEACTYEELIKYFKGTEAQLFFEKVRDGDITISYKPQQVDLIPKSFSGTVKELLEKVDEEGRLDEVSELLDLGLIMENDISKVSGGELQRIAIAATVLKKANFYVFDEPTSYLDIKQRLKVSKFIRSLATPDTAVLVVEHDLIILDYMTDLIHIMYGKEACYGIVSHPKTSKEGINEYLAGHIRDANMRFRDHAIKFESRAPPKASVTKDIVHWSGISGQYGPFKIEAPEGTLRSKEVIGILGENGIGKTSFMKILAGVTKADVGEVDTEVKVAYKSQYLDTTSTEMVATFLNDAICNFNQALIKPMGIDVFQDRRLCDLSGGQLQRVAIAYCLSQDADLYLLDEPSAYLDVEQRLIASKLIRDLMDVRNKACLVIDHDLLFIDYLSQRLMVFTGQPARYGMVTGPHLMQEGMNMFLEDLDMTFRRDMETHRPRANKPNSQLDRKQKAEKKLYYT
ncbi:MAG: ribosome biogenesis/translation initiation ATPase RLI [Candidatus Nanoarchaeia archaeon]